MIQKSDLQAMALKSAETIADHYEKEIDESLRKQVTEQGLQGSVTFTQQREGNMKVHPSVLNILVNRYKGAGYRAEYVIGRPEGDLVEVHLD